MTAEIPGWLAFAQQASFPTLALSAFLFAVTRFIHVLPQLRQHQAETDKSLRADLLKRVVDLEAEVQALRKALDTARTSHASEMMDMLHDLASESGQLDAALMLAEVSPEALLKQLPTIRERRDQHRERLNVKRAVREAAIITPGAVAPEAVAA